MPKNVLPIESGTEHALAWEPLQVGYNNPPQFADAQKLRVAGLEFDSLGSRYGLDQVSRSTDKKRCPRCLLDKVRNYFEQNPND
jgi:hypothetical protein